MKTRGGLYITYGESAHQAGQRSYATLKRFMPTLEVLSVGIRIAGTQMADFQPQGDTDLERARRAKLHLFDITPYEQTLYLDADTLLRGSVEVGFQLLSDGFDLVIAPSNNQEVDSFWHIDKAERDFTYNDLYHLPIQFGAGTFWFAKNERVRDLFTCWQTEWLKFKQHDQAALVRALWKKPVCLALVGNPFNGGTVVEHRHGSIKYR